MYTRLNELEVRSGHDRRDPGSQSETELYFPGALTVRELPDGRVIATRHLRELRAQRRASRRIPSLREGR
jgi:hypothetical protein